MDNTVTLSKYALIAFSLIAILNFASCQAEKYIVIAAVNNGATPMEVVCAFHSGTRNEARCILDSQNE